MNKIPLMAVLLASLYITSTAAADKFPEGNFERAMRAALALHPGVVVTVEAEFDNGVPQYEFDIKGADGKEWEVEVDARTGKIREVEQEVESASDPMFKAKAKVSQEDARKTALAKYPGEVIDAEFSMKSDGNPSYEFDIKTKDGKEIEVEVSAVTGKLEKFSETEIWQIGDRE